MKHLLCTSETKEQALSLLKDFCKSICPVEWNMSGYCNYVWFTDGWHKEHLTSGLMPFGYLFFSLPPRGFSEKELYEYLSMKIKYEA